MGRREGASFATVSRSASSLERKAVPDIPDIYNELAAAYDATESEMISERPVDLGHIFSFAKMVGRSPELVGDVGCGTGHVTSMLSQLGLSMHGVDASPEMVFRARANFPSVPFEVGRLEHLPIETGGWGGAAVLHVTWHSDAPARAAGLRELARAIRPGGALLFGWLESAPRRARGSTIQLRHWMGHDVALELHLVPMKLTVQELIAAGFDVLSATLREPILPQEFAARRGLILARRAGSPYAAGTYP
ncbi:MAG: class I SAM-dependent methyltransferase [Kofleriaceae bacterium]